MSQNTVIGIAVLDNGNPRRAYLEYSGFISIDELNLLMDFIPYQFIVKRYRALIPDNVGAFGCSSIVT